jgi:heme/copper-type cytochrome/quinol oxidase subunit 2
VKRSINKRGSFRSAPALLALAGAGVLGMSSSARASDWSGWWLPEVYSVHGRDVDSLFRWIYWITMVTFVLVQVTLVVFLIKYRHNPKRKKAKFIHGNTRLEMVWTLVPAVILAALAFASKQVWTNLRYAQESPDYKNPAKVMVIGQQFKWNVLYPGPNKEFGGYMIFPKPTDPLWPEGKLPNGEYFKYAKVKGPRDLPRETAMNTIAKYIDQINPLGKVYHKNDHGNYVDDANGVDDDWSKTPGRALEVPVGRPVEVHLTSKDVIHSFTLPNFRIKLDTVPGMHGMISFVATKTSKQVEDDTRRPYSVDEIAHMFLVVEKDDPNAAKVLSIIKNEQMITEEQVAQLKAAGITSVLAHQPGYFDIPCQELCGEGHYTMQGRLIVLSQAEYFERHEKVVPKSANAGGGDVKVASAGK